MKELSKTTVSVLIFTLLLGIGGGYVLGSNRVMETGEKEMSHESMTHSMHDMVSDVGAKSGNDFDKAFLSNMIIHHQGAVLMAEDARTNAKHQEIRDLAEKIITAQNKEILEMQTWEKDWYGK